MIKILNACTLSTAMNLVHRIFFPKLANFPQSFTQLSKIWAMPSYQKRPSSLRKREGNVRFPTNLHGVRRSARPTSRWAPKAHRVMGKTQWRHCERSFGTNVLVLGKERDDFLSLSKPLKRTSTFFFKSWLRICITKNQSTYLAPFSTKNRIWGRYWYSQIT